MPANLRFVLPVLFVIILVAAVGCTDQYNLDTAREKAESNCVPMDFGNGVYYFPCTTTHFVKALSTFVATHPEVNVTAMSSDDTGGYGRSVGYFVTTQRSK